MRMPGRDDNGRTLGSDWPTAVAPEKLAMEAAEALEQAKRLALSNAQSHTKSNFITCDSEFGNLILPVVPTRDRHPPGDNSNGSTSILSPVAGRAPGGVGHQN